MYELPILDSETKEGPGKARFPKVKNRVCSQHMDGNVRSGDPVVELRGALVKNLEGQPLDPSPKVSCPRSFPPRRQGT